MKRLLLLLVALLLTTPAPAQDKPAPAAEAPARMTLPEGFRATLFAGEPDVVQPIAFTFDDRGRLWAAECRSYPNWRKDGKNEGKDRVLIFEDADGDGRFDKRTVFADNLANLSGIEVGFGGVWLTAVPYLLFIPDKDGDDKPDGPPQAVLDGWNPKAGHNVVNGLIWGPDGWLYGCHGILDTSRVGKPGTPDDRRTPINCGVWRYHPTKGEFEVVAHGTTNPWGLDFDDYGQAFITNCVIQHLWHVVPGAHFQRMYGQDLTPHVYKLLPSVADHIHWGGGHWTESRTGKGGHDQAGGGHAHVGCMIYLGDNWPDKYRNGAFTCNIHGNRVNHDTLERRGSTYVARHAPDVLLANDPWFRGLALHAGPDGGVYVSDWTDTGECHNYVVADTSNGRIFKVVHGKPQPFRGDLARLSDAELVKLQLHKNDWFVRHARRVLQERAAAGKLAPETRKELKKILDDHPDVTRKLRALWALHATGGADVKLLVSLLGHPSEYLRAWALRLGTGEGPAPAEFTALLEGLAAKDPSPFVRLHLASALPRLPDSSHVRVAAALGTHAADGDDLYLPLMLWYGILSRLEQNVVPSVVHFRSAFPLVRENLARRLTEMESEGVGAGQVERMMALLEAGPDAVRRDVLQGILEAYAGRREVPMHAGWARAYRALAASRDALVRDQATALAVLYGDPVALNALRKTLTDKAAAPEARSKALQALLPKKQPDLVPVLHGLLDDRPMRAPVLRALAAFADAATPDVILRHYPSLNEEEKADAVQTLASRPNYALALLKAVEAKKVARTDLSLYTVRQMTGLRNKAVNEQVAKVWGTIRPASQERAALTKKYKELLTAETLQKADRANGRRLYVQNCASCHRLFDDGGRIGPELTGSQRTNLDYVLGNLLDPNAVVPADYQVTVVALKDGRVLTGIIKQETDKTLTVQTANDAVIVPKDEIEARQRSSQSMMPEGVLDKLKADEARDLVAYLMGPNQVPLPLPGAGNNR